MKCSKCLCENYWLDPGDRRDVQDAVTVHRGTALCDGHLQSRLEAEDQWIQTEDERIRRSWVGERGHEQIQQPGDDQGDAA